jgi:hypothetical protein
MILNLTEELPPLTKEEVSQVFINTLDLLTGFCILFLQCSPAEANQRSAFGQIVSLGRAINIPVRLWRNIAVR